MSPLAQRCDQCGSALSAVPFEIGDYVCEKCEAPLPGGSRFCPGCGFAFEQSVPVAETVPLTPGFRPSEPPVVTSAVTPPPPVIPHEPLLAPAAPVVDRAPALPPPAPKQSRLGLTVAALVVLFGLGFGLSRFVPPPAVPAALPVVAAAPAPSEADTTDADAPAPPEKEAAQKEETKAAVPAETVKVSPPVKASTPDKPALDDSDTLSAYAPPGSGLDDVPLNIDTLRNTLLSPSDLKHKSLRALSLSHNSIYALHGYIFERASMKSYFDAQLWYHPNTSFTSADLSATEQQNAQTLRAAEHSRFGYGHATFDAQGQPYQQRDPLKETTTSGSEQNDQMLDLDTLQHRLVTPEDLADKSLASLSLSYNAIYAAHGYVFQRASLRHVFESTRWYRPNPAFKESDLDSTEQANLKTIRAYERTRYGY